MQKRKILSLIMAVMLSVTTLFPALTITGSAETDSGPAAFTSISTTRLSMTDQREVELSFNLGYKPDAANLEWTFGGEPLDEW